ncbi:MAG: hypothetical protein U9O53_01660 [archaeon]|nr:hypothetical protein [archaeon]
MSELLQVKKGDENGFNTVIEGTHSDDWLTLNYKITSLDKMASINLIFQQVDFEL